MKLSFAGADWLVRWPPEKSAYLFLALFCLSFVSFLFTLMAMWEAFPFPVIFGLDANQNPILQFALLYCSFLLVLGSMGAAPLPYRGGSALKGLKETVKMLWWGMLIVALVFYIVGVWATAPLRNLYSNSTRIEGYFVGCVGVVIFGVFFFFFEPLNPPNHKGNS